MKLTNANGEAVYYNPVEKNGRYRLIVKAASGQKLTGRNKEAVKSRTFETETAAERYLKRHGYTQP